MVLSKRACRYPSAPTSCGSSTPSSTPSNTTGHYTHHSTPHTHRERKSTHTCTHTTSTLGGWGRETDEVSVCVYLLRRLLEHRGSLVVRQLCVLLDAQHIYLSLAKVHTHRESTSLHRTALLPTPPRPDCHEVSSICENYVWISLMPWPWAWLCRCCRST